MRKKETILVIEDHPVVRQVLALSLSKRGFNVRERASLGEVSGVQDMAADLLLLDIGLPDGNGVEFCQDLRKKGIGAPVIFITGEADIETKVKGLQCGDDYIVKPFDLEELAARVEAVLRRRQEESSASLGSVRLSPSRKLTAPSASVKLSPAEARLIELMLNRPDTTFSTNDIFRSVWGSKDAVDMGGSVRALIGRTRRKLNGRIPLYIHTIGKKGYAISMEQAPR